MKKIKIGIDGMSCQHCVANVDKAIAKVKGVVEVNTSLSQKNSTITALDDINIDDIKKNIENAGYVPLNYEISDSNK